MDENKGKQCKDALSERVLDLILLNEGNIFLAARGESREGIAQYPLWVQSPPRQYNLERSPLEKAFYLSDWHWA